MAFRAHLTRSIFIILLYFLFTSELLAAIKISQISGVWNSSATWGGGVPVGNDDIIISSGTTVSINTSLLESQSFGNLTIEPGASLVVGVNDVKFRISGNIRNDGIINLWQSSTYQADIFLHGNSVWTGAGLWNLSNVNVQTNSLEPADGLTLTLNGSLTAFEGSSFNKLNQYPNITLIIKGTLNTMISSYPDFYYGHLLVNKTPEPNLPAPTVKFSLSDSPNKINLSGDVTLINSTDRLIVEKNNTLTLQGNVTGAGSISGTSTSSLVVDNLNAPAINPLRILGATHFKDFVINRRAGVSLASGFVIRENLRLNNYSVLTLPSGTLTLGVNGTSPTAGSFSGDGTFVGSNNSSMSIRGKDTASVNLRFHQATAANYTLNNLIVDKQAGRVLLETGNLLLTGKLEISDRNMFSIGEGTLILNIIPKFIGNGCLSGSRHASLRIEGSSLTGYPIIFDQVTPFGNFLKSYTQSRKAIMTLANKLNIFDRVNLTGNSSVLVSDGNLTLLASPDGNAGISSLLNNADVTGDVNVQVYISGDSKSMKLRGYRSLSLPISDNQIGAGKKKSLEQLKDYIIITGPGGVANGFDQGGNTQPYAETLTKYNPHAIPGSSRFLPVTNITQNIAPGEGFLAFFRGMQKGSYLLNSAKLNSPFSPPEPVTVVYKGLINKYNIPAVTLYNNDHPADEFKGYNLIGNPYPSAIDWTRVNRSAGVMDEVITLKPGGGAATYKSGISNNGGSPYIQTGQGFYVRTSITGSTVSFKEDCKTSSYPARLLVQPLKDLSKTPKPSDLIKPDVQVLKMNLANADADDSDETTIVFSPLETAEADYNDAMYFEGSSVSLASVSADRKNLAINFMPPLDQLDQVKLYINASTSGSYSLNFTGIPNSTTKTIFLKDSLYPDQLTKVVKNLTYCFDIEKSDLPTFGNKRFSLVFKQEVKIVEDPNSDSTNAVIAIYPNPVHDQISVNSPSLLKTSVQVVIFDMNGAKKEVFFFQKGEEIQFNVSWLEPGVYVAKFQSGVHGRSLGESSFIKY